MFQILVLVKELLRLACQDRHGTHNAMLDRGLGANVCDPKSLAFSRGEVLLSHFRPREVVAIVSTVAFDAGDWHQESKLTAKPSHQGARKAVVLRISRIVL